MSVGHKRLDEAKIAKVSLLFTGVEHFQFFLKYVMFIPGSLWSDPSCRVSYYIKAHRDIGTISYIAVQTLTYCGKQYSCVKIRLIRLFAKPGADINRNEYIHIPARSKGRLKDDSGSTPLFRERSAVVRSERVVNCDACGDDGTGGEIAGHVPVASFYIGRAVGRLGGE